MTPRQPEGAPRGPPGGSQQAKAIPFPWEDLYLQHSRLLGFHSVHDGPRGSPDGPGVCHAVYASDFSAVVGHHPLENGHNGG
eukprot:8839029-Pyramimonas_sp.AAC.1